MRLRNILVVGSINMDIVIRVKHIPAVGETILASSIKKFGGGKGANQAIAAARLGGNVHMIARLGDDDNGRELLSSLRNDCVDVEGISIDNSEPSGTAFIYVSDSGDNNIVVHQGANCRLDACMIDENIKLFDMADLCIIQLEIPIEVVEYVIRLCKDRGIKVILNPAPARNLSDEVLNDIFMLTPNETELSILTGMSTYTIDDVEKASRYLLDKGVENVITTLGEKGSLFISKSEKFFQEAVKVAAVDTTAAGDSFTGALAAALGQDFCIKDAIKYATYAAALAVTREGAQASLPSKYEVEKFICHKGVI